MSHIDVENAENWTILVVDDDEDNLAIAMDTFQMFGATVYSAENGQDALSMLKTLQPTFILLDLSMPVMDGWEMFSIIRQDAAFNAMPVIALTAHAMVGDKEQILAAGFDGYISKPFRLGTVLNEVKACLIEFMTAYTS